jgi:hypothetical protein
MSTQTKRPQELLFSEPSIAETGVWCSLADRVDPSEWAKLCRYIGNLGVREFKHVSAMLQPESRQKIMGKGRENTPVGMPLVSIGPSGVGGEYQWER